MTHALRISRKPDNYKILYTMDIHILWNMYIHCITKYCIRWMYRFLKILCIQWPYWNITSIVLQILHPLYYKYCSTETLHPLYYKHYIHCTTNIVVLKHYIHFTTNITSIVLQTLHPLYYKYCSTETLHPLYYKHCVYNGHTETLHSLYYKILFFWNMYIHCITKCCIQWMYMFQYGHYIHSIL